MQAKWILVLAALCGFLGVALGAFGAHGLKDILEPAMLSVYQTGVHYQQIHALALLAIGIWQLLKPARELSLAAVFMLVGIVLFSGSLYLMTLTGIRALGIITPFGGVSWLVGWFWLGLAGWRARQG